jgi:hypothetical protein
MARSFQSSFSNYGKRLTNVERNNIKLDSHLKQVLVGTILGDVYMRRFSKKANVRVVFRQGSIHASYLLHLYSLFQEFVLAPPSVSIITDKITGKNRYSLSFSTLALVLLVLLNCMNLFIYFPPAARGPAAFAPMAKGLGVLGQGLLFTNQGMAAQKGKKNHSK